MAPTAISPERTATDTATLLKSSFKDISSAVQPTSHESNGSSSDADIDTIVSPLRAALTSESTPLAIRFRALFSLKYHAAEDPPTKYTLPAIQAIAAAFSSPSALLKHELAYCLGQSGNMSSVPYLQELVKDRQEDPMCRHEAAEALGAIGDAGSLDLLKKYWEDESEETVVRETCEIAIGRIEWANSEKGRGEKIRKSDFSSVDPAPPEPLPDEVHITKGENVSIDELRKRLMTIELGLFERYRAMFALRDLASPPDLPTAVPAVEALAEGFADDSALFRHEIAFVFGQLSHPASIPALKKTLAKLDEESMVRHEAAEALGSLGDEDGVEDFLKRFLNDEEQVVRESVVVALDMAEYEQAGHMEYAVLPDQVATSDFSPMVALR